jgi:thiamine-phosphate pyrophosphorylase
MQICGLYAITDPALLPPARLAAAVADAIAGGATVIQYRNKSAEPRRQLQEALMLAALCRDNGALFLVNDDLDLAEACGAQGVHLGQKDGDVAEARARLGASAVIGCTCHDSLSLALAAQDAGANYVAFGRFFPSHTKPLASAADVALLPQARAKLRIPIVAIGGVTVDNAPQLLSAGADAVAVIHALFAAQDIRARARQFAALFH